MIIKIKFENSFLFFGKFAVSRDNVSEGSFSKNSLCACFIKYMVFLSAVARLKNLEAKIPHIKKYMSQNPKDMLMQIWKSANIFVAIWKLFANDFTLKHVLPLEIRTRKICERFQNLKTSRANNLRIIKMKNANISGYCFYMNTNIWGDFQISIRTPLIDSMLLTIFAQICGVPQKPSTV